MELFDAVVAGAGPAGSVLSRTLARNGMKVLLVEKDVPGSRRVCGGFAGPEMTDFFASIGLSARFEALPKNAIRRVRISGARTGPVDASFAHGPGWSVDRAVFDAWLAREAVAEGVSLSCRSTVGSAEKTSGMWRIAVGGDGAFRRVGSRFFIVATGRRPPRAFLAKKTFFACKTVYEGVRTPPDQVTLHFVPKGHVGLNPRGDGKVSMCLYVESSHLRNSKSDLDEMMERLKSANPDLGNDMKNAKRTSDWRTCAADPDRKRSFYRDGTFFAGDAVTMIDPIVGGGISIATASGDLLGRLMAEGAARGNSDKKIASDYEKAWLGRFAGRAGLAASLGRIERSKVLSEMTLSVMGLVPAFFTRLVRSTRHDALALSE